MDNLGFRTRAVHSGINSSQHQGATSIPIYETTAFAYSSAQDIADVFDGKKFGHTYSRISNPTVSAFEQRINSLEEGVGALATSSGMAALSTVFFSLTRRGDEIVSSKSLFSGTFHLFNRIFKKYDVKINFVDPLDYDSIKLAINKRTRFIFLETIGNPKLDVPDIRRISKMADANNIPLVIDSTLATPVLFKAKEFGANIVIHSSTKYISGNGTAIGGVIIDLGSFDWARYADEDIKKMAKEIGSDFAFLALARKHVLQDTGCCQAPFNAYLQFLGLETLSLRMEKHCSNAQTLAEFLEKHPKVNEVNYPGLKNSPHYAVARSQFEGGYGGILTFKLGSKERCFEMLDGFKLVKNSANLGDAKTLAIHPASTIYHDCTKDELDQTGVSDDLVRVAVGIEDGEDIMDDFNKALKESAG